MKDNGIALAGAVHDFYLSQTGKGYIFSDKKICKIKCSGVARWSVSLSGTYAGAECHRLLSITADRRKVLDVALRYGYTSQHLLTGIQSVHGITLAAAKSKGTTLNAYLPINFSVKVTGRKCYALSPHCRNKILYEFIYLLIISVFQSKNTFTYLSFHELIIISIRFFFSLTYKLTYLFW